MGGEERHRAGDLGTQVSPERMFECGPHPALPPATHLALTEKAAGEF